MRFFTLSTTQHDRPEFILVTGGAGYIGSHFIYRLLESRPNTRVLVLDDLSEGNTEALSVLTELFPGRVVPKICKIGDAVVGEYLTEFPVRAAVHFAASALVAQSQAEPMRYLNNNVGETLQLLTHLQQAGIRKFVFSSTAAVYGTPDTDLILEDEVKAPVNVYGKTKLMMEEALAILHEREMLSYVVLRYFNAAGAHPTGLIGEGHHDETHLIPLVLQVANGERDVIKIYGNDYPTPDGTCVRDYVHVLDLADAHIAALDYLESHPGAGETFNLGTGSGNSVQEVIDVCQKVTGFHIRVEYSHRREGDPPVLVAGADKAKNKLNWQPQFGLTEIVKTAWNWEKNRKFARVSERV
jgi:UDP-glucose 4-epimerase